jgi:hypothetical protein
MESTILAETAAFLTKQRESLLQQREAILSQQQDLQRQLDEFDPPPLKWSSLSYVFAGKEDRNAKEDLQAGGDRCQAAAG